MGAITSRSASLALGTWRANKSVGIAEQPGASARKQLSLCEERALQQRGGILEVVAQSCGRQRGARCAVVSVDPRRDCRQASPMRALEGQRLRGRSSWLVRDRIQVDHRRRNPFARHWFRRWGDEGRSVDRVADGHPEARQPTALLIILHRDDY